MVTYEVTLSSEPLEGGPRAQVVTTLAHLEVITLRGGTCAHAGSYWVCAFHFHGWET